MEIHKEDPKADKVANMDRKELEDRYLKQEDLILEQATYIQMQENIINNIMSMCQLFDKPPVANRSVIIEPKTGRTFLWDGQEKLLPYPQHAIIVQLQDKNELKVYDPPEESKPKIVIELLD